MLTISDKHIDSMKLYHTESKPGQIVVLSMKNVTKESILGVGGFSTVFGVRVNDIDGFSQVGVYALTCLNRFSNSSERHVRHGGRDLAVEARLLSKLNHENIIKVHGVSEATSSGSDATLASCHGHFLLLEALEEETLEDQLEDLARSKAASKPSYHDKEAAMDRVRNIATGIAKGLEHLHENNIVLRDLKPSNIGFDKSGCLKLFDLGLAREIHTIGESDVAGTMNYIAPEILLRRKATLKSDIYSFGILLWELITLKRAFKKFSGCPMQFKENVLVGSWRPSLSTIPSKALRQLINVCWDSDPEQRPDITKILEVLDMESPYWISPKTPKKKISLKTLVSPLSPLVKKIRWNTGGRPSSTSQFSLQEASLQEAFRRNCTLVL
jgi:serine/threonine protein kinase